ncbi:FAD-binding protein [Kamptonema cortianum]|nr:FAD-binding protein [Geitlerinema splendidum]MDK3158538.1 FAD-binding protein [Kamptonema cortianum]
MGKLLAICFSPLEVLQASGLANALQVDFDALLLSGESPAESSAGQVFTFGLPSSPPADFMTSAIVPLCEGYSHIAAVSSMQSKDVLPRVAAKLDAAMVTDVVGIRSTDTFVRPMVAGSVLATVQTIGMPVVLTYRPAPFPIVRGGGSTVIPVKPQFAGKTKRVRESSRGGARPDLSQAKVVVSGGRPLKDSDTFEKLIGGLADHLGGAAGATRAAVDSGIAANELQVGQTGKIVAPELYIACGISGSTQHMAGIKDSKIIVAVNTDPDAPIFDVADYGLVMDLYEAIPQMLAKFPKV